MENIEDGTEMQKRPKLKMNANSGMAGAVYSPKGNNKSKGMKKASSSLQHGY